MNIDFLTGYLLFAKSGRDVWRDALFSELNNDRVTEIHGAPKWFLGEYTSNVALTESDKYRRNPPFIYPVVSKFSGAKSLLLSQTRHIVDAIRNVVLEKAHVHLENVHIAVDKLVKDVARQPGYYAISSVTARVSAFGQSLRLISLYGDDVGEAKYFREGLNYFNSYTCGLRRAAGGSEIVQFTNEGRVSFKLQYNSSSRYLEVEKVLTFLRDNDYLQEPKTDEKEF